MNLEQIIERVTLKVQRQGVEVIPEVADRICSLFAAALPGMKAADLGALLVQARDPQASLVRTWNRVARSTYRLAKGVNVMLTPRLATAFILELGDLPAAALAAIVRRRASGVDGKDGADFRSYRLHVADPAPAPEGPAALQVDPSEIPSPGPAPTKKTGKEKGAGKKQ